jgi:dystrophin
MLKDSTQWLEAKEEAEQVIGQVRGKLDSWKEGPHTVDAIQKKITETKVSVKHIFKKIFCIANESMP